MKAQIYQVLHVVAMILLVAFTFQAFAQPDPRNRKRILMLTGIFATVMLIAGFGLLSVLKIGFPAWIFIKLICWFGLAGLGGMAYRMPNRIPMLTGVAIVLVGLAVAAVYFKFGSGSFE